MYSDAWLKVRKDTVRRPDGSTGYYSVVDTADCSLVIPRDGDRLHLVEQYRHPVGDRRWEFPSGSAEQFDRDLAAAAARELREETGLVARTFARLGVIDTMPSTSSQRCTVFLAEGLTEGATQRDVEEQDMESAWFQRTEVERLIRGGVICDAKTIAAYALLLLGAASER